MHELSVTQNILKLALGKLESEEMEEVVSITLQIGELRDIEEVWLQKYFRYVSKNTKAQNAEIRIRWLPSVLRCQKCLADYRHEKGRGAQPKCPICGERSFSLRHGREFILKEIELR